MDPLDIRETLPPLKDLDYIIIPVQGIPGFIQADAITQNFVNLLVDQVQRKVTYIQGIYNTLLDHWKSDNQRGVFNPAPGPMWLASVNTKVAASYLNTGKGGSSVFVYFQQWDKDVPPGTIFSPTPTVVDNSTIGVGNKVPGTMDLYYTTGRKPTDLDIGTETSDGMYTLIGFMEASYFWKKGRN